jgi:Zn-dependent protease with chaperone function
VSRILLFLVFALWSIGGDAAPSHRPAATDLLVFLGGYAIAIAVMAYWARTVARRLPICYPTRFNRGISWMRYFIVAWFAVGMFTLHWPIAVMAVLGPVGRWPVDSPTALVGTLPALIAWIALIGVQYPVDRAMRELNVPVELETDRPIHAPPTIWSYLSANLRLEVLFTLVPVAMILILRDLGSLAVTSSGRFQPGSTAEQAADAAVSLLSAGAIFLMAPVILRHVLQTRPLADSPLRQRLEAMCKNAGLGYREILLWHTDNHMGNAAVMGVLPMVRYILLSDLLLETMSDRQIEAVFAHELGHVAHKHLTWQGVFVVILMLALIGPGKWVGDLSSAHLPTWMSDALPVIEGIGGLLLLFGVLSRFFERQADVYAARTIESINQAVPDQTPLVETGRTPRKPRRSASHVGEYGATVFGSALYRVAVINNISVASRNLTHGSIADRIEYLRVLSTDPARTRRFDRFMVWVYVTLIVGLATCGIWSAVVITQ